MGGGGQKIFRVDRGLGLRLSLAKKYFYFLQPVYSIQAPPMSGKLIKMSDRLFMEYVNTVLTLSLSQPRTVPTSLLKTFK